MDLARRGHRHTRPVSPGSKFNSLHPHLQEEFRISFVAAFVACRVSGMLERETLGFYSTHFADCTVLVVRLLRSAVGI